MKNHKKSKKFTEHTSKFNLNANHIDSLVVIQEVKKHRVIYDMEHPKYHDQTYRSEVWNQIYVALFPNYFQCTKAIQLRIGVLVRRRWKSVRNYIAYEAKLMVTAGYNRKRESTHWSELQFILPYIKSSYCEKVAANMGLKRLHEEDSNEQPAFNVESNEDHDDDNDSFRKEELIKEEEDPYQQYNEDYPDYATVRVYEDISPVLTPSSSQHITTTTTATKPTTDQNDVDQNCHSRSASPTLTPRPASCEHFQKIDYVESLRKRRRTESTWDKSKSWDTQEKLLDLLIDTEYRRLLSLPEAEPNDLDHMFFMGLVSDFKQIPGHMKIIVKAKITTIISGARG